MEHLSAQNACFSRRLEEVADLQEVCVTALLVVLSASGGAIVAGIFSMAGAVRQRRYERQRDFDDARRLAYAQFVTAAVGFISIKGKAALAPESDVALRSAYGATVLLGSDDVRVAADALFAEAWTENGPQPVTRRVRDDFLKAARRDLLAGLMERSRRGRKPSTAVESAIPGTAAARKTSEIPEVP